MVTFSHTIFYVKEIQKALDFYEKAFGFKKLFVHESGAYTELETGQTTLAFASEELGDMNLADGYQKNSLEQKPQACEIAFTTKEVESVLKQALDAGATQISPPTEKPWGQTVAYVRDPNGVLIEIATPM